MTDLEREAREAAARFEAAIYSINMQETVNTEEPTRMQAFEVGISARSYFDGYLAAATACDWEMRKLRLLAEEQLTTLRKLKAEMLSDTREQEIERLRRDKELLTVDLDKLIMQNGKLFDEVNDWRESAAKASRENCGDEIRGDEHHCTCVGPLRYQLVRQAQRIVECEEEVVRRGRLNQLAISLADEFERAVASRTPVGGMSVTPSGDFIACAQLPSAVSRMKWWAREIRKEQAKLEGGE